MSGITAICCWISQKSTDLIYLVAEAWNRAFLLLNPVQTAHGLTHYWSIMAFIFQYFSSYSWSLIWYLPLLTWILIIVGKTNISFNYICNVHFIENARTFWTKGTGVMKVIKCILRVVSEWGLELLILWVRLICREYFLQCMCLFFVNDAVISWDCIGLMVDEWNTCMEHWQKVLPWESESMS